MQYLVSRVSTSGHVILPNTLYRKRTQRRSLFQEPLWLALTVPNLGEKKARAFIDKQATDGIRTDRRHLAGALASCSQNQGCRGQADESKKKSPQKLGERGMLEGATGPCTTDHHCMRWWELKLPLPPRASFG